MNSHAAITAVSIKNCFIAEFRDVKINKEVQKLILAALCKQPVFT